MKQEQEEMDARTREKRDFRERMFKEAMAMQNEVDEEAEKEMGRVEVIEKIDGRPLNVIDEEFNKAKSYTNTIEE